MDRLEPLELRAECLLLMKVVSGETVPGDRRQVAGEVVVVDAVR